MGQRAWRKEKGNGETMKRRGEERGDDWDEGMTGGPGDYGTWGLGDCAIGTP